MATDTTQETLPATNQAVEVAPGTRPCLTPKTEAQTAPGVLSPALSRPLFPDTPPASDERRAQGPNPAQNLHVVQNPAHQPKPDEDMVVESSAPQHDPPEPAQQPAQDHAQSPESQCRPDHSPDPSTNPLGSNPAQNPSPDPSPNSPLTPNPARNSSPNPAENPGQNPALNPDQKPAASSAPPAVEQLLDDLVSDPPKWSALNWAVNNDRGLLYALEEAVKARGASALRARLEPERARIDADAVWAMNQPLLSVVHFIVTGENDIRKKVVRVKDLKRIICSEMGLGAPSKAALEGRVRGEASTPGRFHFSIFGSQRVCGIGCQEYRILGS